MSLSFHHFNRIFSSEYKILDGRSFFLNGEKCYVIPMENVMSLPQGKSTSPDYDPSGFDEKYFAIPIVIFPCKPSLGVF